MVSPSADRQKGEKTESVTKLVHGRANSEPPELFHLANDVSEQNNLASPQPEKVGALKALWDTWDGQQAPARARKDKSLKRGKRRAKKRPPASR